MKYILTRIDFINEKAGEKAKTTVNSFKKDIEKIIDNMFDEAKKIKYTNGKDGYPISVKFRITKKDYEVDYTKDLTSELEEGASLKRKYLPILKFSKKEKDVNEFYIIFKIVKKEATSDEFKMKDIEDFDKYTSSQLRKMLQKDGFNARQKDEMKEILKEREKPKVRKEDDKEKDEQKKRKGLKDEDVIIADEDVN